MKTLLTFSKWITAIAVLLIVIIWMVLASSVFSEFRRSLVEDALTDLIDQPLLVNDDVRIVAGLTSRIYVGGVEIPSVDIPDTALAELNVLEFDLDMMALLEGRIDLDNLTVDGLQVNMLTLADGTTSWSPTSNGEKKDKGDDETLVQEDSQEERKSGGILGFLRTRTASFTSIGLTVDDQISGFEFVFDLENLNLDQLNDGTELSVTSLGTVNGQTFKIDGSYPAGAPFTTAAEFGEMMLNFDGTPTPQDQGGGYVGTLTLDTGAFGDFLEVIGLERVFEGTGNLSAELTSQTGLLKIADLTAVVNGEKGQEFKALGSVENLLEVEGIDLKLGARFHPEGQPPEKASGLKDLKLMGITAHILSKDRALEFEELLLTTNAFDQGLNEVGPVSIGRVRRTPEGWLALDNVSFQAGPRDAPYIVAQGDIKNLLEFEELAVSGKLSAPASLLLKSLGDDVAEAFGGVEATFEIDDSQGHLSLRKLDASTVNTTVWALKAYAELGDVKKLDSLKVDFELGIQDGAKFLGALKLEEVDTGPLGVSASIHRKEKKVSSKLGLAAGTSRIDATLDASNTLERPVIDGRVFSEKLDIADLKNAIAGVVQLSKIGGEEETEEPKAEDEETVEVQPLVLPKEEDKPTDLFDLETLLVETDLSVGIEIQEITGQKGVSSLSSELVAKDGQAKLGPVEVTYGGGYFNIEAEMDLIETPELLSVKGSTSGWDFGEILQALGVKIDAAGKLRGNFNVTGNIASVKTFVNSMYGSASIRMSEGAIATSLLELAGLGIFPWLFSDELREGRTRIVCVVAPVTINAGNISFDSVVAETASVQMVARGAVDWRKDAIALRAEPRRVGAPLARSAWPFEVTGKLSEPKFKLDIGGSKSRRVDGADEMPADRQPCKPDILQLE